MGAVFVDDEVAPTAFLIVQDGFFAAFAGDPTGRGGQALIDALAADYLVLPSADGWIDALRARYGARLHPLSRTSFAVDALTEHHLAGLAAEVPAGYAVQRLDPALIAAAPSIVHISAFESAADFITRGIGFAAVHDETVVGAAYASLVSNRRIEVSVFVEEAHRRRRLATALSAELLLWCVRRGVAPNWDAANEPSCLLAEKLGLRRLDTYTAHYLALSE